MRRLARRRHGTKPALLIARRARWVCGSWAVGYLRDSTGF